MIRTIVLIIFLLGANTACYKYNTHKGRVGAPNTPSPLPDHQQPGRKAVSYGSVPANHVPELVQPITRTVWIKGYKRRSGEWVGDYPLTLIYTRAEFIEEERAHVTIPHSIQIDDGQPKQSSVPDATKQAQQLSQSAAPPASEKIPSSTRIPHVNEFMDALRQQAGPQSRLSVPDAKKQAQQLSQSAAPPAGKTIKLQPQQAPPHVTEFLKAIQNSNRKVAR